jgi:hypothetical protein
MLEVLLFAGMVIVGLAILIFMVKIVENRDEDNNER